MSFSIPIIGTIVEKVIGVVDKVTPNTAEANRLKSEITQTILSQESALGETMKEIALREVSGSPFQRNWRPTLAWMVILMWPWNYIAGPMITFYLGIPFPQIDSGAMTTITSLWAAVYGIGRTFEKTGSTINIGK